MSSRRHVLFFGLLFGLLFPHGALGNEIPPGYLVTRHGGWRWASPEGRVPAHPGLVEFVDDAFARIRNTLGTAGPEDPLLLYAPTSGAFERVSEFLGGGAPQPWTLATAHPSRSLLVICGERVRAHSVTQYTNTLTHEIAHLVLGSGRPGIPRWYHEGMAQWLSGDGLDPEWVTTLSTLARRESLVPLSRLRRHFSEVHRVDTLFYRQSLSFIFFLNEERGVQVHGRLLAGLDRGLDFEEAFHAATGAWLEDDEARWLEELSRQFSWVRFYSYTVGLWPTLALLLVFAFFAESARRRRALRRMARDEAEEESRRTRSGTEVP